MNHVCHHTQAQNTQNSLLLITFLWADSQNSIIFIGSSHTWNMGQTVLSRMFSKYMWLQLWFSNMPFYHKMWEHYTHQEKNVGVFQFAPTQICVHMNSYGNRDQYSNSLDVGSQNPAKSEWGWHINLHPISMLYFTPIW